MRFAATRESLDRLRHPESDDEDEYLALIRKIVDADPHGFKGNRLRSVRASDSNRSPDECPLSLSLPKLDRL